MVFQLLYFVSESENEYGECLCLGFFSSMEAIAQAKTEFMKKQPLLDTPNNFCVYPRCFSQQDDSAVRPSSDVYIPLLRLTEKKHETFFPIYPVLFRSLAESAQYLTDFKHRNSEFLLCSDMDVLCDVKRYAIDTLVEPTSQY